LCAFESEEYILLFIIKLSTIDTSGDIKQKNNETQNKKDHFPLVKEAT